MCDGRQRRPDRRRDHYGADLTKFVKGHNRGTSHGRDECLSSSGKALSRTELERRTGALGQFGRCSVDDARRRAGARNFECWNSAPATGLRFTVLVDRAMDIADCEFSGQGSAGTRQPASAIRAA